VVPVVLLSTNGFEIDAVLDCRQGKVPQVLFCKNKLLRRDARAKLRECRLNCEISNRKNALGLKGKRNKQCSQICWVDMKQQSKEAQKGEIEFRKKLSQQQITGEHFFENEYDTQGIEKILAERMKKTLDQMVQLREIGVTLSPYLEIGAERCQRSLVMENDLQADGAAVDISYDMLKSCDYYKDTFHKNKVPLRVCCDANHLPFLSGSVPFVFCYETLHHFPEPKPIVEEIYRVLSPGGYFLFNEEPYRRVLHVNLYNAGKIYANQPAKPGRLRKIRNILDVFFAKKTCNEVEHGIIENDDITIGTWKNALGLFEEKKVNLHSSTLVKNANSELFHPKSRYKFLLAYLLGGEISGVSRKAGELVRVADSVRDVLICPSCLEEGFEVKLNSLGNALTCTRCSKLYPIYDGVVFLFVPEKMEELYPEIAQKTAKTT
jgi:SAM-dependent methyltransferase